MKAYHNTREIEYRAPFGALNAGDRVKLTLDLWDNDGSRVTLRIWIDGEGERLYPMECGYKDDHMRFVTELETDINGLYWYSFLITRSDNTTMWYGAMENHTGGEGNLYFTEPPSFQLTVSKKRVVPDWYKKGIVYQIFPDRFNRGDDYKQLSESLQKGHENGPERRFVEDWNEPVSYKKDENGRVIRWDFYGGNLKGIKDKFDYFKDMGITVLYINPIFEAASNHRYDTGDYEKIDPLLGNEDDFKLFCREAKNHGIRIILDGVFNHTGCDSKYFNKYGNYDSNGAWQGDNSPYREWFSFKEDGTYDCWWGVDDLPSVVEQTESYKKYIYDDEDSVVRKWLRMGASGWRLDVADELPDDFIAGIKSAMIKENGDDALLLGEVWEDASNKISYSELRKYFLGDELDGVMNYPFRDGILAYLTGKMSAESLCEILYSLYENYPEENFYASLNLIGSHDRMRVVTKLGGAPDSYTMSDEDKKNFRLSQDNFNLAKGRMWIAALLQMTMPGVPCIYYGDEAGMQGYEDPYNRGTFPWDNVDSDMFTMYQNAIRLRKTLDVFTDGDFKPLSFGSEVFGFVRETESEKAVVLVNNSLQNTNMVWLDCEYKMSELISGQVPEYKDGKIGVKLYPLGSVVLYTNKGNVLSKPLEEGKGVLCHITSLPNADGSGHIGKPAFDFVDYLAANGYKYWQMLPINPVDAFGSPYAGDSAFAGNVRLLGKSNEELEEEYKAWVKQSGRIRDKEFKKFVKDNEDWLRPYAMYKSIKALGSKMPSVYSESLYVNPDYADGAEYYMYRQYSFEKAWNKLHEYANSKGISIIGDMPMFVSADSSDVWAAPENFAVDDKLVIEEEAGVPPDYFAKDGQAWGNPVYKWDSMKADGYTWWLRRLERAFFLYDYVRLDHFRGFAAYWSIENGKKAIEGSWKWGPGMELFRKAYKKFGPLPVIAEDLGLITPAVRALVAGCGFTGTDVMQFYDGNPLDGYYPKENKIAYTGTHDNQTILGWCEDRYPDMDAKQTSEKLMQILDECDADVKIVPLQDLLGLGDESRMNMPGTTDRNWSWQAKKLPD